MLSKLKIVNLNGDIIQDLSSPRTQFNSIFKLNDSQLIVDCKNFSSQNPCIVQIWNMSTVDLVKELPDCYLVGVCSFGFLLRRPNDEKFPLLHAYDMNANFIGVISTHSISMHPIEKVTYFGNDLYSFAYEKGFKITSQQTIYFKIKFIHTLFSSVHIC